MGIASDRVLIAACMDGWPLRSRARRGLAILKTDVPTMLEVHCPECQTPVPALAELAGRDVFCMGCGNHFTMPNRWRGDLLSGGHTPPRAGVVDLSFPVERQAAEFVG
jgi:hypothetical protein